MTEPVAWMILKENKFKWEIITDNPNNYVYQEVIPLYTKQQLHQRMSNMKWFVRTKEFDDEGYKVLEDIRLDYYEYGNVENDKETAEYGHRFDTKEEAELWLNPLTEAVQLPVEEQK